MPKRWFLISNVHIFSGFSISVCSFWAVTSHHHTSALTAKNMNPPWAAQPSLQGLYSKLHVEDSPVLHGDLSTPSSSGLMCLSMLRKVKVKRPMLWRKGLNVGPELLRVPLAMGGGEGKGWFINKDISRNGKWAYIIHDCKICLNMERKVATSQDGMEPGPQSLCPNTVECSCDFERHKILRKVRGFGVLMSPLS